ncbi:hypothetical protein ACFQ1O_10580 [Pseudofulvibacter geojedonensis]|uniref:Uncharacterized protein n=2 Tax=Pseudofulvibacter geojedonensis TaxID=1123758 RepID=A0ABW3I3K5_9FLAO
MIVNLSFSQVGIGTTTPSSAAVLHIETANYITTKVGGFIMPVVTEAEQTSIPVTAADDGLMVFVSDPSTGKWCWDIYDGDQAVWRSINCAPVPVCNTQIYLEDFSGYTLNTGRDRRTNSGDYPGGVTWTVDDSAADFLGQDNDYAYTNATGQFELNNTDGPVSFITQAVTISGYATVCFSVDIDASGNLEYDHSDHSTDDTNNQNDYVNIEYSIDGGAWQLVANYGGNGTVNHTLVAPAVADGTFPTGQVSVSGLSGTTLAIRITSNTWASDEKFFYDNILIEGGN